MSPGKEAPKQSACNRNSFAVFGAQRAGRWGSVFKASGSGRRAKPQKASGIQVRGRRMLSSLCAGDWTVRGQGQQTVAKPRVSAVVKKWLDSGPTVKAEPTGLRIHWKGKTTKTVVKNRAAEWDPVGREEARPEPVKCCWRIRRVPARVLCGHESSGRWTAGGDV